MHCYNKHLCRSPVQCGQCMRNESIYIFVCYKMKNFSEIADSVFIMNFAELNSFLHIKFNLQQVAANHSICYDDLQNKQEKLHFTFSKLCFKQQPTSATKADGLIKVGVTTG